MFFGKYHNLDVEKKGCVRYTLEHLFKILVIAFFGVVMERLLAYSTQSFNSPSLQRSKAPPSPCMDLDKLKAYHPEWVSTAVAADKARANIQSRSDEHLGSGILVGIDRLLVPAHILGAYSPDDFQVTFKCENKLRSWIQKFSCARFLEYNTGHDWCIIQLNARPDGIYPGNLVKMPSYHEDYTGKALLVHQENGVTKFSLGEIKQEDQRQAPFSCSEIQASEGSCGGCSYTPEGDLISMHLGQAMTNDKRWAVKISAIRKESAILNEKAADVPSSPAQKRLSLPPMVLLDPNFNLEGKGKHPAEILYDQNKVITTAQAKAKYKVKYKEGLTNGETRNIGLGFYIKNESNSWQHMHSEKDHPLGNPHSMSEYNDNPPKFYYVSADRLFKQWLAKQPSHVSPDIYIDNKGEETNADKAMFKLTWTKQEKQSVKAKLHIISDTDLIFKCAITIPIRQDETDEKIRSTVIERFRHNLPKK